MNKDTIPEYLIKGRNVVQFLIFVAIFSLLFVNIYTPFGKTSWVGLIDDKNTRLLYSSIIVLFSTVILAISRWIMYIVGHRYPLSYTKFFVWMAGELVLIAACYSTFGKFVMHDSRQFLDIWPRSTGIMLLIISIPYVISYLYFSLQDKRNIINHLLNKNNNLVTESLSEQDTEPNAINFMDEKGTLRLSVRPDRLFYIESADNYLNIYYLNKDKPVRFMLRNTLKNMEPMLEEHYMVRCHRSYIVNICKVKILRKEKEGLFLELDQEGIPDIPVSKTYAERIIQIFSN